MNQHFIPETEAPEGDLVIIPDGSALALFTTEGGLAPLIGKVRAAVDAFDADVSTLKGRKAVLAMTTKVVKAKSYLEKVGAELAAEQKEIPKKIDKARREMKDALDTLRDEVRQPLTDWEAKEGARVAGHEARIVGMNALRPTHGQTSAEIAALLAALSAIEVGAQFEEFEGEATRIRMEVMGAIQEASEARAKYESEQVELAELRRLKAERDEADRIATEAKAAEEHAAAAKKAEEERQANAVAKALAEAEAKRDADTKRAEQAANAERQAAAAREAELKAQAEAAERKTLETEARIKREAEAAQAQAAADQKAREEDRDHRANINRAAVAAFVKGGMDRETAQTAVILIASRQIPSITINY